MTTIRPPDPIRTDETNEWAHYSMKVRVPRIARDIVERNPGLPAGSKRALEDLARSIEGNALIPGPPTPGPDVQAWQRAHGAHPGERWLAAEWFYAELAFYREVLAAVRYWETGSDPFEPFKEEEIAEPRLWSRLERVQAAVQGLSREAKMVELLDACLWANRVDLSYTVAASREQRHDADLLVDDRAAAAPLLARGGADVHVVADNAGTELCLDLVLVDAVLEQPDARVTMHVKIEPTFVSDAMPKDVLRLLGALEERGGARAQLASRLREAFQVGRFVLRPDPFWSGPFFMRDAPAHVSKALASATLVVFKGDANYRRVISDALWPPQEPFASAAASLGHPLVCLRTMKSDALLGLRPGQAAELDREDARWRIDGKRGVAQAYLGR
jgi:hypothetical protein